MKNPTEIFASDVFGMDVMKQRLPKSIYHALADSIDNGTRLAHNDADAIAHAMMEWAISKGATHYTHWFQPMTGLTAEKHDAFLTLDSQSHPIQRFSGAQLIQSEPDASSFPSGGTRSTFEARGYTAWDPSSPAFIMHNGKVSVLCIPSVFFSYTGHALDKKTPLLRSLKILNEAASNALKMLTGTPSKVQSTVGPEQEYFLIDRKYYDNRPDLVMAGRTVLGCPPAKGQQMEDHYFGSIKDRVLAFMEDVEMRLYRLGVPCRTRHNEVAPHQFEMAPLFEYANHAADHNQLVMEVMRKTAKDHGLAALLHEKPFAEVNGSGKHINWSMSTAEGLNLLEPTKDAHTNLIFLYFLVAVVNAVHKHGGLLRSTIAGPGNDHRLGANEAPPAIMSVFLGRHLTDILNRIESSEALTAADAASIDLGLSELPGIHVDTTDRNRTSPFAFTGNKFEFRACGSSQSISFPITMINAAVADSLKEMNAELEKLEVVNEVSLFQLLRPFIQRSKLVRFDGNNYSGDWHEEAARRALPNLRNTPEAFEVWRDEKVRQFVVESGLLSVAEMDSRYNVRMENYSKVIGIEANVLLRIVDNHVLPAGFHYQTEVATSVQTLQATAEDLGTSGGNALLAGIGHQVAYLGRVAALVGAILETRNALETKLAEIHHGDERDTAFAFAKQIVPAMSALRKAADSLESLIDRELWTLPTYDEMLFNM